MPRRPRLLHCARILDRLKEVKPLHARLGIIGQQGGKPQAIRLLVWVLSAELSELRYSLFSPAGAGRFSLIKRLGPFARRWLLVAENFTINFHRFVRLVLHGEASSLIEPIALFRREHVHVLDRPNLGVARVDLAQAIEVGTLFVSLTILFGAAGETGKSFRLIGIDEQNLLPVLSSKIDAATRFKRARLCEQDIDSALCL